MTKTVIIISSDFVWGGSHSLTFSPGMTQINRTVSIVNDDIIEKEESVIITFTNPQPPESVLSLGSTTITIVNDDLRELS